MTRDETRKILAVLRSAYPTFYKGFSIPELSGIVDLWAEMFKDDPAEVVSYAVKSMIASRTNNFPPNIGEVKAQISKLQHPNELTELEAWQLVEKALRNAAYGAAEEFAKLPERVQRLVGSPDQLRAWSMMDAETVSSVVASNFQRSFKVKTKSDREYEALPGDVKAFLLETANMLAMDAPKEEPAMLEAPPEEKRETVPMPTAIARKVYAEEEYAAFEKRREAAKKRLQAARETCFG